MVKNGDLNFKMFSHKYFIISLEYISMIVYTNVENHLFSSLDLSPFTIPPGHWETREGSYYPGGHYCEFAYQMDFFNYAGIHRSVTLASVPAKCSIIDIDIITQAI